MDETWPSATLFNRMTKPVDERYSDLNLLMNSVVTDSIPQVESINSTQEEDFDFLVYE